MTDATSAAIPGEWHYDEDGQRKGPVPASEMERLIAAGKITYGSMVWKKGLPEWQPVENSELNIHLHNSPPPLTGTMVNNTIVWTLAFAPVLGFLLEYFVAGAVHRNEFVAESAASSGQYWYITLILNLALSYLDENRLRKAGVNTDKFKGMTWLIPVYLFQRAKYLKQNKAYFIVWLICFAFILFG